MEAIDNKRRSAKVIWIGVPALLLLVLYGYQPARLSVQQAAAVNDGSTAGEVASPGPVISDAPRPKPTSAPSAAVRAIPPSAARPPTPPTPQASEPATTWQDAKLAEAGRNESTGSMFDMFTRWSNEPDDADTTLRARKTLEDAFTSLQAQPVAVHVRCGVSLCRARFQFDGMDVLAKFGAFQPPDHLSMKISSIEKVDDLYTFSTYWPTASSDSVAGLPPNNTL